MEVNNYMTTPITGQGLNVCIPPDDELSLTSKKPAQNKVITEEITDLSNAIDANEEVVADTQSMIATVEATTTASKNYAVGDLLVYDGKLYKVTSAIATGATIIAGSNVTQTTVANQIASSSGGTGFPSWNHQYFEIASEADRTRYFEIANNQDVNEFYVYGEVYFDSYDGVAVHSDNTPLHDNTVSVSATKKFFEIRLWKSGPSYIGLGCVSEWNTKSGTSTFLNVYSQTESAFGNIRIGSYWNNQTMLEGTKVHVWWR